MNSSRAQLLDVTRSALWGSPLMPTLWEGGANWSALIALSKRQTLTPTLSAMIKRIPLVAQPSRNEALKLHNITTINRLRRSQQIEALSHLLPLIHRAGVERPVLLKGLGVGLNYPDPTLRMYGDIDLYVGDTHYDRACSFISKELNIEGKEGKEGKEVLSDYHFEFRFMNCRIELHRYANSPSAIPFQGEEFMRWSRSELEGNSLREVDIEGIKLNLPPPNFDFIYIFFHIWSHLMTEGIGLRQLCDWVCYVESFSDRLDREELARLIKRFRFTTPLSLLATLCVRELGIAAERFEGLASCNNNQYQRVMDKIWSGGNFGFYARANFSTSRTVIERKFLSFRGQLRNMLFMLKLDWRYTIMFYARFFYIRITRALNQFSTLLDPVKNKRR